MVYSDVIITTIKKPFVLMINGSKTLVQVLKLNYIFHHLYHSKQENEKGHIKEEHIITINDVSQRLETII